MSRIISILTVTLLTIIASSCCCTSDTKAPKLKNHPKFMEFSDAPEVDLDSSK